MATKESMDEGPFEEYFKDGSLKRKGSRNDGYFHGPFEEYYPNGQLKEKCSYANGHKNGSYESYYKNGQLEEKCFYKHDLLVDPYDLLDGPYESYHENGQLRVECTYKQSLLDGAYRSYHDNGQLREKCCYINGFIDRPYIAYYKNGQLSYKYGYKIIPELEKPDYRNYIGNFYNNIFAEGMKGNLLFNLRDIFKKNLVYLTKIGIPELANNDEIVFDRSRKYDLLNRDCKSFYSNGQIKFENKLENCEDMIFLKTGVETFQSFYKTGQIKFRNTIDYSDFKVSYQLYHKNGEIKVIGYYDELEEQLEHYYKDGGLREYHKHVTLDYYNDNKTFEKYYANGQLHYRINLKGGRRHGPFELYDEHGVLIEKGSYDGDEIKDGPFEGYFEDGQLYQRSFYKNGLLEGSFEEFHPNGDGIRIKENYVNGEKQEAEDKKQFIGFD